MPKAHYNITCTGKNILGCFPKIQQCFPKDITTSSIHVQKSINLISSLMKKVAKKPDIVLGYLQANQHRTSK